MSKKRTYDTTLFALSFSSIETLHQCPRKFFLRYIERLFPKVESDYLDYGNLIHEIGENYYYGGMPEIKRLYREHNIKYTITPEYRKKLKQSLRIVKNYVDVYVRPSGEKQKRELNAYFDLNKWFDYVAKIDIFYKDSEGYWVVADWKTSKSKKDHSKQLASYYWALRKKTGKIIKKMKAHIVYVGLESGEEDLDEVVEEYILDESDIDFIETDVDIAMEKIANMGTQKEKWRKKCGPLCDYCDYKKVEVCDGQEEDGDTTLLDKARAVFG